MKLLTDCSSGSQRRELDQIKGWGIFGSPKGQHLVAKIACGYWDEYADKMAQRFGVLNDAKFWKNPASKE